MHKHLRFWRHETGHLAAGSMQPLVRPDFTLYATRRIEQSGIHRDDEHELCWAFAVSLILIVRHPILPFCFFEIKVNPEAFKTFILRKKGFIPSPQTLGEHLRNRRLVLGLRQEDVAEQFGTLREVYERWERDQRQPVVSEWPDIIAFLGYYPAREERAADVVLKARRCQGMDQKALAHVVGVIHQRLRRWERDQEIPTTGELSRLRSLAVLSSGTPQPKAHWQ